MIKRLLHTEQCWGRSLLYTVECLVKASFCVKCILHVWHRYGVSPVCVFMRLSKFGPIVKTSPQTEHTCLSPVCNLVCWFKPALHLYILPHQPKPYGHSTLCTVLCFSSLDFWINCWPQTEQCYRFSPVCIFMCKSKFKQTSHTQRICSALFPLTPDCQTKCSQLLAEEYYLLFCEKEKFTSLLQNNQRLKHFPPHKLLSFWSSVTCFTTPCHLLIGSGRFDIY